MDIKFHLLGQSFTWNEHKASSNLRKHGISFERACEVFFDPFVLIQDATDGGEQRESATGLTEAWDLLFVVHIEREDTTIRIISARAVTEPERSQYEEHE